MTPWTATHQASLSFTVSRSLFRFMTFESVMPPNHLILYCPLLLPSVFPSIGSFPMSRLCALGGQSIGASASVLPVNSQGWFPLGLSGLISLQGFSESYPTPQFKSINSSSLSLLYGQTLTSIHDYWKNLSLTKRTCVGKVMSLAFNMLSRLVRAFLWRSKHLLISWMLHHLQRFGGPKN